MQPGTPVVLRPSPWKWAGVGAICLVLALGGALLARQGRWIGWVSLLFFGVGLLVSVVAAMPTASYLRLDPEGFTICSLYRAHKVRWTDVTGFGVGRIFLNKMVMFNFEPTYQRTPGLRSLNAGIVGYEAGLPDNYGLSHEELADLMNNYRDAALAG